MNLRLADLPVRQTLPHERTDLELDLGHARPAGRRPPGSVAAVELCPHVAQNRLRPCGIAGSSDVGVAGDRLLTEVLELLPALVCTHAPGRDWKAAAVIGDPEPKRLAMVLPMESDRRILVIAGLNGEAAPTDHDAMLTYARELDSTVIADVMATSEPLGEPAVYRFPANQRRHMEKLRRFPVGWAPLGDAVCSFDPIYGQGMTSAAQQAQALGEALDGAGQIDRAFARRYFRAARRIVSTPWSIAVGGDFAYDGTTGRKPTGTVEPLHGPGHEGRATRRRGRHPLQRSRRHGSKPADTPRTGLHAARTPSVTAFQPSCRTEVGAAGWS